MEQCLPDMIRHQWETLHRWFGMLPERMLEEKTELYFIHVYFQTVKGDWQSVRHTIARAESICEDRHGQWSKAEADKYMGLLYLIKSYEAVDYLFDWERAVEYSRKYFEYLPGGYYLHDADINAGEASIAKGFQGLSGRLKQSETFFATMSDVWRDVESPFTSIFLTGYGEIMYERNKLDEAEAAAVSSYELALKLKTGQLLTPAAVLLSKIYMRRHMEKEAFDILDECYGILDGRNLMYWTNILEAHRLRLRMSCPVPDAVRRWKDANCELLDQDIPPFQLYQAVALVRLRIESDAQEAMKQIRRLRRTAELHDRLWETVELWMLESLIHYRSKAMNRAADCLTRSLELAASEGYVRTFLDEGRDMLQLLTIYVTFMAGNGTGGTKQVPRAYAKQLLALAEDELRRTTHSSDSEGLPAEPLTAKEQQVLSLLAEGMPNKQIAAALDVSVGTVKTHLNRIYGKLNVNSRWEAIQKKRGL